jgi:hypothetical protein
MAHDRFNLQGGLGNQLFIYYAAVSYALTNKQSRVTFDTSALQKAKTRRHLALDDFNLPLEYDLTVSKFSSFRRLFASRLNKLSPWILKNLGYLQLSEVGFEQVLWERRYSEISGYFQSWRYFKKVDTFFPKHKLRATKVSQWALDKIDEVRASDPILCHIRKGDYLELQDSFGNLSYEYYKSGIKSLRALGVNGPVWIMTDSPSLISKDFLNATNGRLIIEPENSGTSDVFSLMQQFQHFVISNSTFSWWAAFSGNSINVVAPKPWFKNLKEPTDLVPESWNRINADWS